MPTRAALEFVGARDLGGAVRAPGVHRGLGRRRRGARTCGSARQADLVVVAPATADLLARAAAGLADDLLTSTLLTARCPVLWPRRCTPRCGSTPPPRPTSRRCGGAASSCSTPPSGRLTGADSGPGRLPEPAEIFAAVHRACSRRGDGERRTWPGGTSSCRAGGTREHLDPVRFLGNRSSGRQGYALAATALARGAEVTLVAANVALPDPAGVKVVRVVSADAAARGRAGGGSAERRRRRDGRRGRRLPAPRQLATPRSRRAPASPTEVALVRNPDMLAELSAAPPAPCRAGRGRFRGRDRRRRGRRARSTARAKLARKGCDLLVVNEVGGRSPDGLRGSPTTPRSSSAPTAPRSPVPLASKEALADVVWDRVSQRLAATGHAAT